MGDFEEMGSRGGRGRGGFRGRGRGGGGRGRGGRSGGGPEGPIDQLKLYVGSLSWGVDDAALQEEFSKFGPCEAKVMTDKFTGRSRGFGFVTYESAATATNAIAAMNGKEIDGRAITCNNARQMVERPEGEEPAEVVRKAPGVCFAWQRGECQRGDACRFAHSEDANAE